MRVAVCLAIASLALVHATPLEKRQDINFDVYQDALANQTPDTSAPAGDVSDTTDWDPTSTESAAAAGATSGDLQKRGTCQANAPGGGPAVHNPDTDTAFENYQPFSASAFSAPVPQNYHLTPGFIDLNGSASSAQYMGVNSSLTSYSSTQCAYQCNHMNGCVSFNIFYERDPTLDADDTNCPNPPSLTRIKCSFWGLPVTAAEATNTGQYQAQFHVVIAGSNAYSNTPSSVPGYTGPTSYGASVMQVPTGDTRYMGQQTFADTPFAPEVCAAACNAKSQQSIASGSSRVCNFFNAFILYENNDNGLFTCAYYTTPLNSSYATNTKTYDSAGNQYTYTQSYVYSIGS